MSLLLILQYWIFPDLFLSLILRQEVFIFSQLCLFSKHSLRKLRSSISILNFSNKFLYLSLSPVSYSIRLCILYSSNFLLNSLSLNPSLFSYNSSYCLNLPTVAENESSLSLRYLRRSDIEFSYYIILSLYNFF